MEIPRKVTPELRVLVAFLMPHFELFGDKFLVKVAEDIIDRTWSEGTKLSDDAWYTLRLSVLRAFNAPMGTEDYEIFLPRYDGATDFETDDFNRWIETVRLHSADSTPDKTTHFAVSEVIGPKAYEI